MTAAARKSLARVGIKVVASKSTVPCHSCGVRPLILSGKKIQIICGNPLCAINVSTHLCDSRAEAVEAWNVRAPIQMQSHPDQVSFLYWLATRRRKAK